MNQIAVNEKRRGTEMGKKFPAKKLKIAYILSRFPAFSETFISNEIWWLRYHGYDVRIFSLLKPRDTLVQTQSKDLMQYVNYSPPFLSWEMFSAQLYYIFHQPIKYFHAVFKTIRCTYREPLVLLSMFVIFPKSVYFARQMEALGVERIHAHFIWVNGVGAMIISSLIDIPFSLHPHAFGLFQRDPLNARRQLEDATNIFTITEFNRNFIASMSEKILEKDIIVIHCGVDIEKFEPTDRISTGSQAPEILSIARLVEMKGMRYLIEACKILNEKNIPFRCSIAGDGELKGELEELIQKLELDDKVKLLGSLKQTELIDLFQRSDIFALPCVVEEDGNRDGLPIVLMEAMAMKLPVISTPVAGIPELVHHEENGLLVASRDAAALAQALEKLVSDEALRKKYGECGRHTVITDFNVKYTSAALASHFERLRNSHAG
jgi:glycosyltransferase involved in cell wall biosynthesis